MTSNSEKGVTGVTTGTWVGPPWWQVPKAGWDVDSGVSPPALSTCFLTPLGLGTLLQEQPIVLEGAEWRRVKDAERAAWEGPPSAFLSDGVCTLAARQLAQTQEV